MGSDCCKDTEFVGRRWRAMGIEASQARGAQTADNER